MKYTLLEGIMALKHALTTLTEEEYLAGEEISEIKHEYIDGEIYAITGVSKNHERISGNFFVRLHGHLENSSCEPFSSDVKVKVGKDFFYPDAMVVCDDQADHDYYTETPTVIIEVLSKSTRRYDMTIKRLAYQSISTLQEYILIEQDFVDVEVCRKNEDWQSKHYFLGGEFTLNSIGITLKVDDLYQRVKNEDVSDYLKAKTMK